MTYKGLKDRDIPTLRAWIRNHMSRKATAKELYISLSTLDYRLASIRDRTGLNPRHFLDLVQLRETALEMWPAEMSLSYPFYDTNERS